MLMRRARFVRRTIDWLKEPVPMEESTPTTSRTMRWREGKTIEGNPSIFVRFFVAPDYFYDDQHASKEKVAALNEFLDSVRDECC